MKKNIKRLVAVFMATAFVVTTGCFYSRLAQADAVNTTDGASLAIVKDVADFRSYIDNEGIPIFSDSFASNEEMNTKQHTINVPFDGTLLIFSFGNSEVADGHLYSDLQMTKELKKVSLSEWGRESPCQVSVKAGTYYYSLTHSMGISSRNVITYIGLVPKNPAGVTYTDTSTKYDRNNNVSYISVRSQEEFKQYVNSNGTPSSNEQYAVGEDGLIHSFTVEESGWLFMYPIRKGDLQNSPDFKIYSNANLSSSLLYDRTEMYSSKENTPYTCYLTPGTYYYKGFSGPVDFTMYLGFMKDSDRFSIASAELSKDASSTTITFQGAGTIRVQEGHLDPAMIGNDYEANEFWKPYDSSKIASNNTVVIKKNGTYVARLEVTDGFNAILQFNVSGIKGDSNNSAASAESLETNSPNKGVSIKHTYKIKVAKKQMTVKPKKKIKIRYQVSDNYVGKVRFFSSNKKIATVNKKGVIKTKKKGKCKITLKLFNGKKAVIRLKVR